MYRVLIADDEPFILEGIKHLIDWEEYGMIVSATAKDGLEALKIIETTGIDIVITDIKMPKISGLELIRRAREMNSRICFIVLSGYDDFAYLKESIKLGIENYLLKPVNEEELLETLVKTVKNLETLKLYKYSSKDIHVLRNNIMYRWVTGSISEEEVLERSKLLDIKIDAPPYYVCIMKLFFTKSMTFISQAIYEIEKICAKKAYEELSVSVFSTLENEIGFIIHYEGAIGTNTIKSYLKECTLAVRNEFEIDSFITVGEIARSSFSLNKSFTGAKELLKYSMIMPYGIVIDHDKIETNKKNIGLNKFNLFEEIGRFVATKDTAALSLYIEYIFSSVAALPVSPDHIRIIAAEILFSIINSADMRTTGKREIPDALVYNFSIIYKETVLNEIMKIVKETACGIMEFIASKQAEINPIIKRVLDYSGLNYSRDISIKSLAHKFNINPNYLGQLFKEETGEFFSDYINKLRINKVKELLKTDMSVKEISYNVGYIDTSYFYKVFKKYTGISPTEYRNQYCI